MTESETGEVLLSHQANLIPKMEPFAVAVTDRAVYLLRKRWFAIRQPYYYDRIPHSDIRSILVTRRSSLALLLTAVIMVIVGAGVSLVMLRGLLRQEPGLVSGIPLGVTVAGAALGKLSWRRRQLVITHHNGKFLWKMPLAVDRSSRDQSARFLVGVVTACRYAGLPVVEEAA